MVSSKNSGPGVPVTRQISVSAKYYEPAVYGLGARSGNDLPSVLSSYRDLILMADSAASGFIPMSAVPSKGRNTKLFAIGILPPNVVMDEGLELDRSSTVGQAGPEEPNPTTVIDDSLRETIKEIIARHCIAAGLDPDTLAAIIELESGFRPARAAPNGIYAGLIQFGKKEWADVARIAKRPEITWDQMREMTVDEQMPYVIIYMKSRGITGTSTAGQYYRAVAAPGFVRSPPEAVVYKRGSERVRQNPLWDRNKDGEICAGELDFVIPRRPVRYPPEPKSMAADANRSPFVGYGPKNAHAFREDVARQTDMLRVKLSNAQRSQRLAVKYALEAMRNTPPLRLLVNPNSFEVKSQKIVSDGNWGRNGPIIEFWGDDQDKISGSGQVAAFYSLDANPQLGRGGPGLTRHARNHSLAWQNFQSLYLLYRNNGGMYLSDMSQQDRDVLLTTVGSVYLFYDNILYIGCFDSLNVSEADLKPFSVEYNFEFTVRAAFLLEYASDANYGGAPTSKDVRGLPTQSGATSTQSINDIAAFGGTVVPASTVQGAVSTASDALVGGTVAAAEFLAGLGGF